MKYKVIYLREMNDVLTKIKVKTYREIDRIIKISKNKSIELRISQPSYIDEKFIYFFVDIDKNKQFYFKERKSDLDSESLDTLFGNKFLRQLTNSLTNEDKKINWIDIILGILIGSLITGFILFFIFQNKINSLYEVIAGITNPDNPVYPF